MIVIIQCAGRKQRHAGHLVTTQGTPVLFVASPDSSGERRGRHFARPDDVSDTRKTWRQLLWEYNQTPQINPLGLLPAYQLYQNPIYARLVERFGIDKVFILSAGWGLIRADFLTPDYDITYSVSVEPLNRRKKGHVYHDFCMLPECVDEAAVFFGGKDYLPLLCSLTTSLRGQKTVYFNSAKTPNVPGWALTKFETNTRTNWHYECAASALEDEDLKMATGER
jgi:hypothetical protein